MNPQFEIDALKAENVDLRAEIVDFENQLREIDDSKERVAILGLITVKTNLIAANTGHITMILNKLDAATTSTGNITFDGASSFTGHCLWCLWYCSCSLDADITA